MSNQKNAVAPALKHGAYSGLTLLPTEDRAAFEKLHRDLTGEYAPNGRSEEIVIEKLARLIWRRDNLAIYILAAVAREKRDAILSKLNPSWIPLLPQDQEARTPEELAALRKELDARVQRELGPTLELVEIGAVATSDYLVKELAVIERVDGMIVRLLKQLLLIRGVKSVSSSASTGSSIGELATPPRLAKRRSEKRVDEGC